MQAIEDNQHQPWVGCPCKVIKVEETVLSACEDDIFSEVTYRAERVLSTLPSISIGMGIITWYLTPAESAFQLACAVAAFAAMINDKPTTIAFATHPDNYDDISRMAGMLYGSGTRRGFVPPIFSLGDREGLDIILRNVVMQRAQNTMF